MLVAALDRNLLFSGYDACDRANSMSASLPWQHISPRASTYLSATADPHPQWHAQPPPPQPPSSSSWNTLDTQYSSFYSPPAPPIPHPSASTSPALSEYPESSQRTVLSASLSPSLDSPFAPTSRRHNHNQHHTHNQHHHQSPFPPHTGPLYTLPDADTVKVEDESTPAPFVFEASPAFPANAAPPPDAQVPLRATQAGKRMRRMMGVFRLDPFAVQAAQAAEARPLAEEGKVFEFQLTSAGLVSAGEGEGAPGEDSGLDGLGALDGGQNARGRDDGAWGYPLPEDLVYATEHRYESAALRARREADALRRYASPASTAGSYSDGFESQEYAAAVRHAHRGAGFYMG